MSDIIKAETPAYSGDLTISVTSSLGLIPIDNATITISYSGEPNSVVQTLTTDDSGLTATISLPAPNLSYSTQISDVQPYSEYNISVTAPGYEPVNISGTEILPDVTAIQPVTMNQSKWNPQAKPKKILSYPTTRSMANILPRYPRMKSNRWMKAVKSS